MNDKAKIAALRAALEGMLEYTGSIDPAQGMDEFDCDAVKVAAKALALTADDAEQAPNVLQMLAKKQVDGELSRSWPEDWSSGDGQYMCNCSTCGLRFFGNKRRVTCKLCATSPNLIAGMRLVCDELMPTDTIKFIHPNPAPIAAEPAPTVLDPVVEANRALLHERSQVGIAKYGATLGAANLSERELLVHALQESLDLSNYLQANLQRLDAARRTGSAPEMQPSHSGPGAAPGPTEGAPMRRQFDRPPIERDAGADMALPVLMAAATDVSAETPP